MHQPESLGTHLSRQTQEQFTGPPPFSVQIPVDNDPQSSPTHRLTIKLPPMAANANPLRRSTRRNTSLGTENSLQSGSEYHESERSMEVDPDADAEGEEEIPSPKPKEEYTVTARGRKVVKKTYIESDEDGESGHDDVPPPLDNIFEAKAEKYEAEGDDEDDEEMPRRTTRRRMAKLNEFIVSDEDTAGGTRYSTRSRSKKPAQNSQASTLSGKEKQKADRQARRARRNAKMEQEDGGYVDDEHSPSSPDGEFDDAPRTSSDLDGEGEVDADVDVDGDGGEAGQEGRPYALRQRAKINYAIPPPLEEMRVAPKAAGGRGGRNSGGRNGGSRPNARRGPGWSATGAELGKWMGMPGDDSVSVFVALFSPLTYPAKDSDYNTRTPRKPFGGVFAGGAAVAGGAGGMLPGDMATAGTPSNMGKIGDACMFFLPPHGHR